MVREDAQTHPDLFHSRIVHRAQQIYGIMGVMVKTGSN